MPWKLDGTFERDNTIHSGDDVWQADDAAGLKIIDELHDLHDEDLALGIANCLNLDGYNAMRADLDMGDFVIKNVGAGSSLTDVAQRAEIADDLEYDPGTGLLELKRKDGTLADSVTIAAGGGGSGTVTSVTAGEGLDASPNPIQTTGTVSLEVIGADTTYQNGIKTLQIDKHGRFVSAVEGAFRVDLNTEYLPNQIVIQNTSGDNASIEAATQSQNGYMSSSDKTKLDNLPENVADFESGAFVPTASGVTVNDTLSQIVWYRIGQMVHFYGSFNWLIHNNSGSDLQIGGLPYEAVNVGSGAEFLTGNWVANTFIAGFDSNVTSDAENFTQGLYITEGAAPKMKMAAFYGRASVNPAPGTISHVILSDNVMSSGSGNTNVNGWYFITSDSLAAGLGGTSYAGTAGATIQVP